MWLQGPAPETLGQSGVGPRAMQLAGETSLCLGPLLWDRDLWPLSPLRCVWATREMWAWGGLSAEGWLLALAGCCVTGEAQRLQVSNCVLPF